jgi:beta-glucosidase
MMAHNELSGIPCHAHPWLMQDVLRNEMGFEGFVVSDWMDMEHIYDLHRTAVSVEDAYAQSVWRVWICICMDPLLYRL